MAFPEFFQHTVVGKPCALRATYYPFGPLLKIMYAKDHSFFTSGHQSLIQYVLYLSAFAQIEWVSRTLG